MELNKIKRLQYNQSEGVSGTILPSGGSGILNTILVSDFNGFDYPDATPFDKLAIPFKSLLRARDYLVANSLTGYTIKVFPGSYTVASGKNMDHNGVWQLEDNVIIQVNLGWFAREYLFTGAFPVKIVGKGKFVFNYEDGVFYYPYATYSPASDVEVKSIEGKGSLIGIGTYGYYGGWITFRNVSFNCTVASANLFTEVNVHGQVMNFEGCSFNNYFLDMQNYSGMSFIRCNTYGFIPNPAVSIGAATIVSPTNYAVVFLDCDFDLHSNYSGGILLKSGGVKLCVGRSRFNRGDNSKYALKSDFNNLIALSAIGTSPVKGSGVLTNVYGADGFKFIDPAALPYLLSI